MKILKGLDNKIDWFSDELSDFEKERLPTFRKLIKNAVGGASSKTGDESIDLYQIGLKLKCDGDIEIENAEFNLMKRVCEEFSSSRRPDGWVAHVQGQVLLYLKNAEIK